ncbi:MAG: hypothetical protein WCD11_30385 [Solirubrobacteraceae bacterium]
MSPRTAHDASIIRASGSSVDFLDGRHQRAQVHKPQEWLRRLTRPARVSAERGVVADHDVAPAGGNASGDVNALSVGSREAPHQLASCSWYNGGSTKMPSSVS